MLKTPIVSTIALIALTLGATTAQPAEPLATTSAALSQDTPGALRGRFVSPDRIKTRGATSEKNLIVFLKPKTAQKHEAPTKSVTVLQEKLQFEPHVLPVMKGTKVVFNNKDTVKHNVFAEEDCCSMDTDMPSEGRSEVDLSKSGVIPIICRLHPDMSMFIIVLDDPYFTSVEIKKNKIDGESVYDAEFSIEGVPAGDYTLSFWHKTLEAQEFDVTIAAGETLEHDIKP